MRFPQLEYSDDTAHGLINRIEDITFAQVFADTECEVTADDEMRDTGKDAAHSAIYEAYRYRQTLEDVLYGYYQYHADRLLSSYGLVSAEKAA